MDISDRCIPKYIETRGFIYLAADSKFPNFFKVGRTTNAAKRLDEYNTDRPFPTIQYLWVSQMLSNALQKERHIMDTLQAIEATTACGKREWVHIQHLQEIFPLIRQEIDGSIVLHDILKRHQAITGKEDN